jgi:hypothetical protein
LAEWFYPDSAFRAARDRYAKDDTARMWYKEVDFEESPTDQYQLCLLMKDAKAMMTPPPRPSA